MRTIITVSVSKAAKAAQAIADNRRVNNALTMTSTNVWESEDFDDIEELEGLKDEIEYTLGLPKEEYDFEDL